MIATIRGTIIEKPGDTLTIEAGGLGYEVFVTAEDWGAAKLGSEGRYYIHDHIREDLHALYGFAKLETKQFFGLLLGISGVGPKVAMGILSAASLERLQQAIAASDPDLLKGVSGVGKKTAERIVVELRGKVDIGGVLPSASSSDAAYQALLGLGYTAAQASGAVAKVPASITGDEARIKAALKELS